MTKSVGSDAAPENAPDETASALGRGANLTSTGKPRRSAPVNPGEGTVGSAPKKAARSESKSATVLKMLRAAKGVTVAAIIDATGWQAHSVRGFLSGTVKKKLGMALVSEVGKDGQRRYRTAKAD